jgi:ribosomal protein L18E
MRNQNQTKSVPTFESVWSLLQESIKNTKEMVKEMEKSSRQRNKESKEFDERMEKESKKFDERMEKESKKYDERMDKQSKKFDRKMDKMYAESRREMKELNKQMGGITNSNGEMAESYFYNAFKKHKIFAREQFDDIKRNRKLVNGEHDTEFDIILFNCKSAALIEVKYNAKPDNISIHKIISRVKAFKILFPECRNHNVYLGVAAMSFRKGMEERLHRAGIATVRQLGKKMVVYDKDVKVF